MNKQRWILGLAVTAVLGFALPAFCDIDEDIVALTGRVQMGRRTEAEMVYVYNRALIHIIQDRLSSTDMQKQRKGLIELDMMNTRAGVEDQDEKDFRPSMAKALAMQLEADPAHTDSVRISLIRLLETSGGEESVNCLTKLLNEANPNIRDAARKALQCNPSDKAEKALIAAMGQSSGNDRIAIIRSLGNRKNSAAIGVLEKELKDPAMLQAAAAALGQIGTEDAADALDRYIKKNTPNEEVLLAWTVCADKLASDSKNTKAMAIYQACWNQPYSNVRKSAIQGLVGIQSSGKSVKLLTEALNLNDFDLQLTAARLMGEIRPETALKILSDNKSKIDPRVYAAALRSISTKHPSNVRSLLNDIAQGSEPYSRSAALDLLGDIGDSSCVSILLRVASDKTSPDRETARASLDRLDDKSVNQLLLIALPKATTAVRGELIRSLHMRHVLSAANPIMSVILNEPDPEIRLYGVRAMSELGSRTELPGLMGILVASSGELQEAAEKSAGLILSRIPRVDERASYIIPSMDEKNNLPTKAAIYRLLGKTGSVDAMTLLRIASRNTTGEERTIVIKCMSEWPDDRLVKELANIAISAENDQQRDLAIAGVVNGAAKPLKFSNDELADLCAMVFPMASAEYKRKIISVSTNFPSLGGMQLAMRSLDSADMVDISAESLLKIIKPFVSRNSTEVIAACRKIIETRPNTEYARQAKSILDTLVLPDQD